MLITLTRGLYEAHRLHLPATVPLWEGPEYGLVKFINSASPNQFSGGNHCILNSLSPVPQASQVAQTIKNPLANAGYLGLIPGSGRSPAGRHGNPLKYSYLGIPWTKESGELQSIGSQRDDMTEQLIHRTHTPFLKTPDPHP